MIRAVRTPSALRRAVIAMTVLVGAAATLLLYVARPALGAEVISAAPLDPQIVIWAFASAAVSTGLGALAAGYAVARVGSAAIGAVAENPDLFGRVLILVGLAEGIAIYGLIISVLILNRVG